MRRAVRNLIRFIASAVVVFGALEIGLELVRHQTRNTDFATWHLVVGGALIIAGILLFAWSGRLAGLLTDEDDDDDDEPGGREREIQIPPGDV